MPRLEGIRPGAPGLAFLILSHPATRDENTASLLRNSYPQKRAKLAGLCWPPGTAHSAALPEHHRTSPLLTAIAVKPLSARRSPVGQGHGSQNTKQPPEKQGPEEKRGGDGLNGGQWSRKGRAGTEASSLNLSLSWERCTVSPEYIQSVHGLCTGVTCTHWGHREIKRVVLLLETGSLEPSTEAPVACTTSLSA